MLYLKECAKQYGIELTDLMLDQFQIYYEMLVEKNKVMNLTAITEKKEVILKHFLDSIAILQYGDLSGKRLLDVGTGAGFPGIPLKIVCPEVDVTLLDSLNKRVKFLDEVIETLKLSNCTAIHSRAEDGAHNKEYREQFDFVVSRAVANLSTLSEYCIPFVKEKGMFISYKSGEMDKELNQSKKAIKILGGKIQKVEKFTLLDLEHDRSFVFIEKCKKTPKQYPRKSGTPSKNPIGSSN